MPLPPPITSRTNARVKALRTAFSGKANKPGERAGIEGWKTLEQALEAGFDLDTIAFTQGQEHHSQDLPARELLVLSPEVMASVADTLSPPQILATLTIPNDNRPGPRSGLFLVLEEIQDPGNLGTLIRSAEAFGVERVYLSPGCANPWAPKVIRASAGSILRQPVVRRPLELALHALQQQHVRLMAAVAAGDGAIPSQGASFATPLAILIGNEGAGLSPGALALAHERVYIPCRTESLNAAVAGSILLHAAQWSAAAHPGATSAAEAFA